ncbi:hypothetical protein JZ751_007679 [Albula glossodonta]|uniref:Tetraspanin n=1 Tax=Albula glossodonta TaxID=121402 RepID=A0A8T2N2R0_9TELE|nr:hypothetical protein JZ751_007679 [Albula glossodonta]
MVEIAPRALRWQKVVLQLLSSVEQNRHSHAQVGSELTVQRTPRGGYTRENRLLEHQDPKFNHVGAAKDHAQPDYRSNTVCAGNKITGAILLAVGVWGKLMLGPYISLIADNSTNAPYVLIGTGTTIIVFGLFGCFATCRGSPWMLKLSVLHVLSPQYAMFLSLVFLAELVAGISGFVFRHELRCCGVLNYTSWYTSIYFPANGFPVSCCANMSDCNPQDLRNATIGPTKVHQQVSAPLSPRHPAANDWGMWCHERHKGWSYNELSIPDPASPGGAQYLLVMMTKSGNDLSIHPLGCYELVTSFIETNMGIIAGVAFGIAFSQRPDPGLSHPCPCRRARGPGSSCALLPPPNQSAHHSAAESIASASTRAASSRTPVQISATVKDTPLSSLIHLALGTLERDRVPPDSPAPTEWGGGVSEGRGDEEEGSSTVEHRGEVNPTMLAHSILTFLFSHSLSLSLSLLIFLSLTDSLNLCIYLSISPCKLL